MKLAMAGDSAGALLAMTLAEHLTGEADLDAFEVNTPASGTEKFYANLYERVALGVLDGTYDRAILCCGTGIGVTGLRLMTGWRSMR